MDVDAKLLISYASRVPMINCRMALQRGGRYSSLRLQGAPMTDEEAQRFEDTTCLCGTPCVAAL